MDWLIEILNKIIKMFHLDTFQFSSVLFAIGVVSFAFLIEYSVVGWEKSSVKRILQFDKTIRNDFISWFLVTFNFFNV
ncbi:MAG: hypothetical protein PHQ74_06005 [Crocinitomicaceae bacterium]|nr:hypothetical protein [Crocinitomicaceae bacterium]